MLTLRSPAFEEGTGIPRKHTCEGKDVAPALEWSDGPEGTRSFALIVDDPDAPDPRAPKRVWVHWVLYDLPASTRGLPEGGALPAGAREGRNDSGQIGYQGPCPPIGRHRYYFKLYALDTVLGDRGELTKAALLAAMEGHVLAHTQHMGTYEKQ